MWIGEMMWALGKALAWIMQLIGIAGVAFAAAIGMRAINRRLDDIWEK